MTSFVGNHGLLAVFILMFVAAVLPAASELTMIYGGALASGALAGHISHFHSGFHAYLAVVVTGVVANVLGAIFGWALGYYGGHALLERHGRWLHATPERVARAERWFERFGLVAVPLGFAVPVIRSFVAVPAGIFEWPLRRLVPLAAVGCIVFSTAIAGIGWAVGSSWSSASHDLRYVDYLVVAGIVVLAAYWIMRIRRAGTIRSGHGDSSR
ncbi:MAG TPA: DedA family protein [Gaiellaceae bacterium]|jgi:membrane protein DedA with SNARE-associated domain|nr:DedA family protein [Gaiellaceae bacterium]